MKSSIYSGSYQLVSEHSILSAQRTNKVAARKVRVEESAPPEMEESDSLHWFKNEALPRFAREDPIGWISKAERFFEEEKIRSSHKTQWAFMRMEGVAQDWFFSWCQEDLDAEWESFAVDLIKRFKEPESKKSEERIGIPESEKEEEGVNEELKVDLNFQKLDVVAKSQKSQDSDPELEAFTKPESVKNEGDVCKIMEGAIDFVRDKERRSEIGGDLEPRQAQVEIDAPREKESLAEEPPPKPPNRGADSSEMCILHEGGATAKIVVQDCDLREGSLSFVTGSGEVEKIDGRIGEGREVRGDGREPPWETPDSDVTVAEMVQFARDLGKHSFSRVTDGSDMFGGKRKVRADWISCELGFWTETMGQAQYLLVTPNQLTNTRRVFLEKKRVENIAGLLLTDVPPSQASLHEQLPTVSHHIRIFNFPLQYSLVIPLLVDHLLSPTLSTKRLAESSLATILMLVKNENGMSNWNGWQLHFKGVVSLIKLLVGIGRCGSELIHLIKVTIVVMPPLIHEWDPGGNKQDENILKTATIYACHGNQTPQHQRVLFNFQLSFVDNYEGASISIIADGEKELVGSGWAQNTGLSMKFIADATVFDPRDTILYVLLQNTAEQRTFDSGGSFSISCIASCFKLWDPGEPYSSSCIAETSCFQLWDPGGRLLIVCFCYLHLEDKVNV